MDTDKACPHVNIQPANMFPPAPPFFLPCGPQAGDMMKPFCNESLIPGPKQCGPCMLLNIPFKNKPCFKLSSSEIKKTIPKDKPNTPKIQEEKKPLKRSSSSSSSSSDSEESKVDKQKKIKRKKGLRSKSRELRAGIFYSGCDCEKRNGLQDDCRRTECRGSPSCKTVPPSCGPSEFSNAKHLVKKKEKWLKAHPNKVVNEKFSK